MSSVQTFIADDGDWMVNAAHIVQWKYFDDSNSVTACLSDGSRAFFHVRDEQHFIDLLTPSNWNAEKALV